MDSRSQKPSHTFAQEATQQCLSGHLANTASRADFEAPLMSSETSHKETKAYRGLSLKEVTRLISQSSMEYQLKRMKSRGW